MRGTLSRLRLLGPLLFAALVAPSTVLAARDWTVVAQPSELELDTTRAVLVTVRNTTSSGNGIHCVSIDVHGDFDISSVAIVSIKGQSGGGLLGWSAVWPGSSKLAFKAGLLGEALEEDDTAVFRVTGTPTKEGAMTWRAVAADNAGVLTGSSCGSGAYPARDLRFNVVVGVTPTPTPTATPTPMPTPTPTPRPTATPRPTSPPIIVLPSLPLPSLGLPLLTLPPLFATPAPTAAPSASPAPTATSPAVAGRPQPPRTPSPTDTPGKDTADDEDAGGGFVLPRAADPGDRAAPPIEGLDDAAVSVLQQLPGGLLPFTGPAIVLGVPGLLVILAIGAQALGALAWLPIARRKLGGFEIRRAKG